MLLDPLSQTVTPSRTPSLLERDVLYGRPQSSIRMNSSQASTQWHQSSKGRHGNVRKGDVFSSNLHTP